MVRTPGSHPGNRGSIPLGTTYKKAAVISTPLFLFYFSLNQVFIAKIAVKHRV